VPAPIPGENAPPNAMLFSPPPAKGSTPFVPPGQAMPGQKGMLPPMPIPPGRMATGQMLPAPLPSGMQGDPRINSAFARGVDAQRRGDFAAAASAYREVLQLQPKAQAAHVNMALVLLQQKNSSRAVWHLKQAISLAPREAQPRAILAQTYANIKEPRKAYEQWTQLADLKLPDNGQAAFFAGAVAFEQLKNPTAAERWLRMAQGQSKNSDPRVPMLLARVLMAGKKQSEAAQVLQAAGKKYPQITEIQTALADAQWQSGQKDQAISTLLAAEKSTPSTAPNALRLSQIRVMLGRALAQQKQFPEAAKALRGALAGLPAKSPAIKTTKLLLAQTLASQAGDEEKRGQTKNAIATWSDAIAVLPDNALGYSQRARLAAKTGDDRAALNDYNRAIKLAPRDLNVVSGAAQLEEKTGDPNRALAHWKTIIENRPASKPAYFNLARLGAKQKQLTTQLEYIETRLRKNPDIRAPYDAVLDAGEKSGRGELTRNWVSSMAKRYPKSAAPRNALIAFERDHPSIKPDKTPTPTPAATPAPTATPTSAPRPTSTPATTIAPFSKPSSKVTNQPKSTSSQPTPTSGESVN